tara:strand:- start:365 stop:1009 length:645 start_codon:yes stop_codon:yes gene_type:complete
MKHVQIADLTIGNDRPLTIIAGPCQLESADHAQMIAGKMKEACDAAGAQYIFKASYDKANRTSISGVRGPGMEEGLEMLASVKKAIGVPVLTDIHTPEQCAAAAQVCDVLQIPALLCRQTDLILAAGHTGAAINVKKGQFLAPWDMQNIVTKIESTGNETDHANRTGHLFWIQHTGHRHAFDPTNGNDGLSNGYGRHALSSATCRPWWLHGRAA